MIVYRGIVFTGRCTLCYSSPKGYSKLTDASFSFLLYAPLCPQHVGHPVLFSVTDSHSFLPPTLSKKKNLGLEFCNQRISLLAFSIGRV